MISSNLRSVLCLRPRIAISLFLGICIAAHPYVSSADVFVNSLFGVPEPEPFSVSSGDSLNSLFVNGSSEITMTGGSIIHPSSGFTRSPLRLEDNAKAAISGGLLRMAVNGGSPTIQLGDNSEVDISGGQFESSNSFDEVIIARNQSNVTISGGQFSSDSWELLHMGSSGDLLISSGTFTSMGTGHETLHLVRGQTTVTGGSFNSQARGVVVTGGNASFTDMQITSFDDGIFMNSLFLNSTNGTVDILGGSIQSSDEGIHLIRGKMNISGGSISGGNVDLNILGGVLNIIVQSAMLDGNPIPFGTVLAADGELSVVFANGDTESLSFLRSGGTLNVVPIPEPSTLILSGIVAVVAFGNVRRRVTG